MLIERINEMNTRAGVQSPLTIDLSQYNVTEIRMGPDPRGPARCIHCQQVFKSGETWWRLKSRPDPQFGSYFVGIHERCGQTRKISSNTEF